MSRITISIKLPGKPRPVGGSRYYPGVQFTGEGVATDLVRKKACPKQAERLASIFRRFVASELERVRDMNRSLINHNCRRAERIPWSACSDDPKPPQHKPVARQRSSLKNTVINIDDLRYEFHTVGAEILECLRDEKLAERAIQAVRNFIAEEQDELAARNKGEKGQKFPPARIACTQK